MPLKTPPPLELTAASVEIDLNDRVDKGYLRSTVATGRASGRAAWTYYNDIGEVHYALNRTARVAGYARFIPVLFKPHTFEVESVIETGQAADIVASLYSPYGGVRGLVERYFVLQKVPGDSYLVRLKDRQGQWNGYHFASPDELDVSSFARWGRKGEVRLTTVPASYGIDEEKATPFTIGLRPEQMLGRAWSPSRRFADIPESSLHALSVECDALMMLTKSIKAQLLSRFALAGILFLPPGVSMASVRKGGKRVGGQLTDDVMSLIIAAMTKNVKNHDDAVAALPLILRGANADDGEKIKHILFDRSIAETDLKLRAELIDRIQQSLDSSQDAVKGPSQQSHFGAWACMDQETEVMTQDGWKRQEDLTTDDVILTLNHETGCSEWNQCLAVHRYDVVDEEMLEISTNTHYSLSTLNHRWPILQRTTENMEVGLYRRWKTSEELGVTSRLITGAPSAHQPTEAKWSDDFVELMGWYWTEGSHREGKMGGTITISQSQIANPDYVARIRRCLTGLYGPASEADMRTFTKGPRREDHHSAVLTSDDVDEIRALLAGGASIAAIARQFGVSASAVNAIKSGRSWVRGPENRPAWTESSRANDMAVFRLNTAAAEAVLDVAPRRMVPLWWVRDLTPAQLDLFVNVSVMADGSTRGKNAVITQKDPAMLDAVELAAILSGRRTRRNQREVDGFTRHTSHCLHLGVKTVADFQKGGLGRKRYTGTVWCPTTSNGTWLARRNGRTFYTGNSADDERRVAVGPDLESLDWALTLLVMRKQLSPNTKDYGRIGIWHDLSAAAVKANQQEDARQAHDRILVSDPGARRMSGISEDDAPTPEETVRGVGRLTKNPYLMLYGTDEFDKIDWELVKATGVKPGPAPDSPAEDPEAGPGRGDPGSPDDRETDIPRTQRPV